MEKKKTKKKLSKGAIVLIVGIVIIAIPVVVFLTILITAALQTGRPVLGSRYENDLNPAITNSQTQTIEKQISSLSGVEKCVIELRSAQYRINIDTVDSLSSEQIRDLTLEAYNTVNANLPVSTYFTSSDSMKMYDLDINTYNFIDGDNNNMILYILTKNSKMETYTIQNVTEAVDEELAKELRGETIPTVEENSEEN